MCAPGFSGHIRWVLIALFSVGLSSCYSLIQRNHTWPELVTRMDPAESEISAPLVGISPGSTSQSPFIGVQVTCRSKEYLFQLDTGSSVTLIRQSLQKEIGATPLARAEIITASGSTSEQTLYTTSRLKIGEFVLRNEVVAFVQDEDIDALGRRGGAERLEGVLGASLLHRGEIELAIEQKRLFLRSFSAPQVHGIKTRVALVWVPDNNGFVLPLEVGTDRSVRFLLDTGSNSNLIFDSNGIYGKKIESTPSIGTAECRTLRGTYTVKAYRLPFPVKIAGHTFDTGSTVFVEKRQDGRHAGSLGTPFLLSHRRVVLNAHDQTAAFEPK
ncbi:MAG: clan AA aspartic protease [Candidatus Omnitrophica bacterium]|nr:clan AA aspartic protease [Candidatus Omnitrophota bacterium]